MGILGYSQVILGNLGQVRTVFENLLASEFCLSEQS